MTAYSSLINQTWYRVLNLSLISLELKKKKGIMLKKQTKKNTKEKKKRKKRKKCCKLK